MRRIDFPIVRDYQRNLGDVVWRPMLVVEVLAGTARSRPVLALVDSGADESMFHVDIALRLGIDLSSCRTSSAVGVGGRTTTHVCIVELEVEGQRFPANVRFTTGLPATTALLGRHDVFERFRFCFDQRARQLLIQSYS
jgi:hypothetical protein